MVLAECAPAPTDNTSLIINIVMAAIALVSAVFAILTYTHQRNRSKKAEACNLAAYYAKTIIEKSSIISSVFAQTGIDQYIRANIDYREIKDFDRSEMEKLLEKRSLACDDFVRKIYHVDPFVILNCRLAKAHTSIERDMTALDYIEVDKETGEQRLRNEKFLVEDFLQELTDLLNQLEWFGMNFQYEVADETLLYQSLHKTYLSLVWMLYPIISYNNVNNEDKLFTNVVWLFDKWRSRLDRITTKAQNKKRAIQKKADRRRIKADKKAAKADQERARAEEDSRKADQVRAKVHRGQRV